MGSCSLCSISGVAPPWFGAEGKGEGDKVSKAQDQEGVFVDGQGPTRSPTSWAALQTQGPKVATQDGLT